MSEVLEEGGESAQADGMLGGHVREDVCGGRLVGTPRDRLPLRFLIRCYQSRTSQHGLETDSQRFSVSFTMFCCYWRISFCLFVLQCHILPCSRFNFLIEKMYYGCLFFVVVCFGFFFFYVISFDLM